MGRKIEDWSEKRIIEKLKHISISTGKYPSENTIKKINPELVCIINRNCWKYGKGFLYYNTLLGFKPSKPTKWTNEKILLKLNPIIASLGRFPKVKEIIKFNSPLASVMQKNGMQFYRDMFNVKITQKSPGYWSEERIVIELKKIIERIGRFPKHKEIKDSSPGLDGAMHYHGGTFHFYKILGIPKEERGNYGISDDWGKLEKVLIEKFGEMISVGTFPGDALLLRHKLSHIVQRFGGIKEVARKLGCNPNRCWISRDGHQLDSIIELIVDEYLYSRQIWHKPHLKFSDNHNYRCDQFLGEKTYLEVWGYPESPKKINKLYNEIRKKKEKIYCDLGINLIPIEGYKMHKGNIFLIEKQLDDLFLSYGFSVDKKNDFDLDVISKSSGCSWTQELVITELKKVIEKIGDYPTQLQIVQYGCAGLMGAVARFGGNNYFRKSMNYKDITKPKGYWNEQTVLEKLKEIIKIIGKFPTRDYLQTISPGLPNAIFKYGGFNHFRTLLKCKIVHITKWSDEDIIKQLKEVILEIGHFPSLLEMNALDKNQLCSAISRNGGLDWFRNKLGFDDRCTRWNDEEILKQIRDIIADIGCFPTQIWMKQNDRQDLLSALTKRGGSEKYKRLLGCKTWRRQVGWNEESIAKELSNIADKINRFPNASDLKNMSRFDLLTAIYQDKGFDYFRNVFGLDSRFDWSEDKILKQLKEIIFKIGHYPTAVEMGQMNKKDLILAIRRNGGTSRFKRLMGYLKKL